jgi:hypothetical protein
VSNLVFDNGLQVGLDLLFNINGPPGTLSGTVVDDSGTAFTSAFTSFNGTNVHGKAFDTTPARSAQTVTSVTTYGTSDANFTHKRVGLPNATMPDTSSPVGGAYAGIDSMAATGVVKTSSFSVKYTLTHTAVNVGAGNNIIVNQGLQVLLDRLYGINGPPTACNAIGVDDNSSSTVAGDTTYTGTTAGRSQVFDSVAARAGGTQTVAAQMTIASNKMLKTLKRLHWTNAGTVDDTASAISGLLGSVNAQTIQHTSDFALGVILQWTSTSA